MSDINKEQFWKQVVDQLDLKFMLREMLLEIEMQDAFQPIYFSEDERPKRIGWSGEEI